jgi:pyrroline-5-carboxylate reductase
MSTTIGVVGTGNMGSALVRGWLRSPQPSVRLLLWDKITPLALGSLTSDLVSQALSLEDLVANADVIFVVVKPKNAQDVLGAISCLIRGDQAIVSCMAGVSLEWMRTVLGPRPALFRIMPNLGVELGVGAVAVAAEPNTSAATVQAVMALLKSLGLAELGSESMLDALAAVSGTGPAFLALAIEGLEDGAVKVGLTRPLARKFVRQTALATAELLALCSDSPARLREHVAMLSDIDAAGADLLEDRDVRLAFQQAVEAAMERSRHLQEANPLPGPAPHV